MKRLSLYLFLILLTPQIPSLADDIRDFQINGISVGDSLLDYVSKETILSRKKFFGQGYKYINKEYSKYIFTSKELESESYELTQVMFKSADPKHIVMDISGRKYFDDVKNCYKKQKEIESEFDSFFKNTKKIPRRITTYSGDKTGKSKVTRIAYRFNDGSRVGIQCYKWSKEELKENRNKHRLSILIGTSEYIAWNVAWWKKFRETK
jgi:ABC-type transport system involved in Fe-S cluster assembly fused permease/ATPase subunit